MIKLSIVIPYHNEPWEKIKTTFEYLNNQKDINTDEIEIIVVNNCEQPIKPINLFNGTLPNLHIRYALNSDYIDNIGMSRQKGIEESLGQFILFIDSDDVLYGYDCLSECMKAIDKYSQYDLILFENLQEFFVNNEFKLFAIDGDKQLISGKLYKREFILNNLISHLSSISYSEDTIFNLIFNLYNPKTIKINRLLYVHKYNKDSVTRKNFKEFVDEASLDFIKGIDIISEKYYNKDESFINTLNTYIDDFGKRIYNCLGNKQPDILTAVCKYLMEKNINKKDE